MKKSFVLLTFLICQEEATGFVCRALLGKIGSRGLWNSKLFGPDEDFDEGRQAEEGKELAKQFYEQLEKRNQPQSRPSSTKASFPDDTETSVPKKKFTGKPSDRMSTGIGGGRGPRSPREQMMQREFDLVNRAEKGLAFQGVLAGCILILYLYVGLTGGITSGVDDFDLGADDTIADELILPERRDSEASYWL